MSEYEQFRIWAEAKARELAARPEAERAYLREIHGLAGEFLIVSDGLHDLGRGSLLSFWKRLHRWWRLAPDPLAAARARMRQIRARYG
jgi:hypothetical protein